MRVATALFLGLLLASPGAWAETLNLDQAVELALSADPRIKEREAFVRKARGLLQEAEGNLGLRYGLNTFMGLAPEVTGGFWEGGATTCSEDCKPRDDRYDLEGLSLWTYLEFSIVKPLYTFGKVASYSEAAEQNITVKKGDVALQRAETRLDVMKAYYGYLAARDTRYLLEDVRGRVGDALELVERWLAEERGTVKLADKYALESGAALLDRYLAQAEAVENVALDGLKLLTGIGLENPLQVADSRLRPVELPAEELETLKARALELRPEMKQVEAGLRARRALVEANKASKKPDIYAGIGGVFSAAPERDKLDNPYTFDQFNYSAASPVVGLRWQFQSGVQSAQVEQARAELEATLEKASLARQGIPFQVAEQYHQMQAHYKSVQAMRESSLAARRWMIAAYTELEAGLEKPEKVLEALKTYVVAHSDYLSIVNDYNMYVAKLNKATGEFQ
jgi:outer membrane protein TolC